MLDELRIYRMRARQAAGPVEAFRHDHAEDVGETRIQQAGFWTTVIGESSEMLYYMLKWESLAEREKKWAAFGATLTGSRDARRPRRPAPSSPRSRTRS